MSDAEASGSAFYLGAKRALDVVASLLALLVLSPLLVPIAIALRFTGEGYVFYSQERIGLHNSRFRLLKFATMLKNSPNLPGGTITTENDPRVLPLGRFLRKTKINELPQLINVLRGDMSIVGPRPQTEECFLMFPDDLRDQVYRCRPGITGIGSVVFRNEEEILSESEKSYDQCYREDIMPYKAELEIWYAENRSLYVDIMLILLTAVRILFPNWDLHQQVFRGLPQQPAPQAALP